MSAEEEAEKEDVSYEYEYEYEDFKVHLLVLILIYFFTTYFGTLYASPLSYLVVNRSNFKSHYGFAELLVLLKTSVNLY